MSTKRRLSASIDAELLDAAEAAVSAGTVPSVSAWVNEAFRRKIAHEQRLAAMDEFLRTYEDEFGTITEAEMAAAKRSLPSRKSDRVKPGSRSVELLEVGGVIKGEPTPLVPIRP
jgi:hypothetical protein